VKIRIDLRSECVSSAGEFYLKLLHNKTDNVRNNVILRSVRAAMVAVEKQYVLHILSACL